MAQFSKKNFSTQNVCFDFLYLLCETFLIIGEIQQNTITNVYSYSCKVPVLLFRFERNVNFLNKFLKNTTNINCYENPSIANQVIPCGRTDRQTDTKQIVTLRNVTNAPKTVFRTTYRIPRSFSP
jgi:hypothetical protein